MKPDTERKLGTSSMRRHTPLLISLCRNLMLPLPLLHTETKKARKPVTLHMLVNMSSCQLCQPDQWWWMMRIVVQELKVHNSLLLFDNISKLIPVSSVKSFFKEVFSQFLYLSSVFKYQICTLSGCRQYTPCPFDSSLVWWEYRLPHQFPIQLYLRGDITLAC